MVKMKNAHAYRVPTGCLQVAHSAQVNHSTSNFAECQFFFIKKEHFSKCLQRKHVHARVHSCLGVCDGPSAAGACVVRGCVCVRIHVCVCVGL